ncbi:MAG: chemotaxis protein CheW [Clostridia bacterium]|nr:chemotaxis protein CheW [Clostridia bacterium]MDD4572037.1 chemotaxis protein CheW [Clostridia bacterium]
MAIKNQKQVLNSAAVAENNESISTEKYLTFFIDKQLYAIPSNEVIEIMCMQPITHIPNLPPFIKGVINLRGKIVPIVDMRSKFDKESAAYGSRTNIIVVETEDLNAGLIVDTVNDVSDIAKTQIQKSQNFNKNNDDGNYVWGLIGIEDKTIMCLDLLKILDDPNAEKNLHNLCQLSAKRNKEFRKAN